MIGTGASAIQIVPQIQPQVDAAARLPAHRRRGSCPTATGRSREFERRLYRRVPARQRPVRAMVYCSAASCSCRDSSTGPQLMNAVREDRRRHLRQAGPRPGAARQAHARLRDRLQAHPAVEQVVSGARQPNVELVTERDRPRSRQRGDRRPPTGREHEVDTIIFATGFHVTDIAARRAGPRARRRAAVRRLARQPAGLPRHRDRRLPEPVPARRPEHRPRPQLDRLHDRVPAQLRDGRAARRWTRRGAAAVEVRAEAFDAYNQHVQDDSAHGLEHRRLRELVHRPQRPQQHDLAGLHVALLAADASVRRGRLRADCAGAGVGSRAARSLSSGTRRAVAGTTWSPARHGRRREMVAGAKWSPARRSGSATGLRCKT